MKFGGHAMAAGLTLERKQLERFIKVFDEVVSGMITEAQLQHLLLSDGELHTDDYNLDVASMLRDAGPWGQAFPEPLFDDTFRVLEQRIVGDRHLKLRLGKGEKILDGVAFFIDSKEWPNHRCQSVRAAYRLDVNEYKGRRSVQLIIEYLEAAD
jgi:single-stranded-DNA-specific exonuclease